MTKLQINFQKIVAQSTLGLSLLVTFNSALAAESELIVQRNLAATCASCHGSNGHSADDINTSLAGKDKQQMIAILKAFQSNKKTSSVMQQITKGYSSQQLQLIAAYFAKQKK